MRFRGVIDLRDAERLRLSQISQAPATRGVADVHSRLASVSRSGAVNGMGVAVESRRCLGGGDP